jgi:GNAT superfamily N-acetyltransferase
LAGEVAISHREAMCVHPMLMAVRNAPTDVSKLESLTSHAYEQPSGERLLDNPIWNALGTGHRALSIGDGQARRYPPAIGPLSGTPDQSIASYNALRPLAGTGGVIGLFFQQPPAPPHGWALLRGGLLSQMIWQESRDQAIPKQLAGTNLRQLTIADVPAMIKLAELTEPGPFRERTIELGNFYGVFDSDRLLAMAGQRMSLPGFVEVSAVCTHPDARGRGYARTLMSTAMQDILQRGSTPFLHVLAENLSAIRVYESLGFIPRRTFHLAVLKNDGQD